MCIPPKNSQIKCSLFNPFIHSTISKQFTIIHSGGLDCCKPHTVSSMIWIIWIIATSSSNTYFLSTIVYIELLACLPKSVYNSPKHDFRIQYFARNAHCLKITQHVALEFWHLPPIFVLLKLTCLVTLFDCKLQVLKNSPKWTSFGIFN